MNRFKIYLTTLVVLAAGLVSCRDKGVGQGEGYIKLSATVDYATVTKTDPANPPVYQVQIVEDKINGKIVASYDDHRNLPETIRVQAAKYLIKIQTGDPTTAGFDNPSYSGEEKVTIKAGETQTIQVTAHLSSIKLSLSLDEVILLNFPQAKLIIKESNSDQAKVLFTIDRENQNKDAYIPAIGSFYWQLILTNIQGVTNMLDGTVVESAPRDYYKFSFEISEPTPEDNGAVKLNLLINKNTVDVIHLFGLILKQGPAPQLQPEGNFTPGNTVIINELVRGKTIKYNITAECQIGEMWLYHQNEGLTARGIPRAVRLDNIDPTVRGNMAAAGITFSDLLYEQTAAYIDFSSLSDKLPLGNYDIRFTIMDKVGQYIKEDLAMAVMPDQDHMITGVTPWACFATINGEWCTLEQPAGLSFEYKADGEAEWTKVPTEQIILNGMLYAAKVKGLTPGTTYHCRSVSNDRIGNETSFTTDFIQNLPNLNFDDSHYRSTGSGMTGASGVWFLGTDDSFWATGNPGTKAGVALGRNITESTDDAIQGKAVKMVSAGGVTIAGHAAGNLFSGTFAINGLPTNTTAMRGSVKFGRPYTGRPTGLKGYYKYTSKVVSIDTDGMHGDMMGKQDRCQIFISLENWNGASSRPSNPIVIGYGELVSPVEGSAMTQYAPFEFKIDYKRTEKPTHIVFIATSSIHGGDFCGGVGSELYVDEFELLWD